MIDLTKEGWGHPYLSKKFHYFKDARALCGKWMFMPPDGYQADLPLLSDSPDNCVACSRKLAKSKIPTVPIILYPLSPGSFSQKEIMPANGKKFTLKELQGIVGGRIQICYAKDDRMIVCNEEGKLSNLPINEEATKLYVHGSLNPADWALYTHDFIVGDVLVCPKKFIR